MALDIKFGDLELRPSETEQQIAAAGGVAILLGLCIGSRKLAVAGALTVAGVAYAMYEEAETFRDPAAMNAHFQTDGRLSATRGAGESAALAALEE